MIIRLTHLPFSEGDLLGAAWPGCGGAALYHVADESRVWGEERARIPLHRHDQLRHSLLLPLHRPAGR